LKFLNAAMKCLNDRKQVSVDSKLIDDAISLKKSV